MNENVPSAGPTSLPVPNQSAPGPAPAPAPRRRRWFLYGCGAFIGLVLIVITSVLITIWYIQRPIQPVVLSPEEKSAVELKLERLSQSPAGHVADRAGSPPRERPRAGQNESSTVRFDAEGTAIELDRTYVPGSKILRLTERELNGLLNANTDLGKTLRFELGRDAINAYLAAPIPEDVPVLGGKIFRARGRFRVLVGTNVAPYAVLEDVTVFGLSLPKAWLGGIKGENLLADAVGGHNGKPVLQGVKSLRIEPGAIVLEVED